VRERQGREPSRTARHWGQLQFHCGNPPPAAAPSTRTHTPILHLYLDRSPWPGSPHGKTGMVREPGLQPGTLSAYSESGQIPAYAVTSALVPISSNSGVSHFWSSMAITSSHSDFIVHAHRDVPFGTLGGI